MSLLFLQVGLVALAWTIIVYRLGVRSGRARTRREVLRGTGPVLTRQLSTYEIPSDVRRAIEDALSRDEKIGAIRILRKASGMGLKESKEAIEANWP